VCIAEDEIPIEEDVQEVSTDDEEVFFDAEEAMMNSPVKGRLILVILQHMVDDSV